jgi:2-hydroxychromene-2-carboxylate isomerase
MNDRPDPAVPAFEFWFDVGSAYSYIAWRALPDLERRTGARAVLRPMLLGGVFKATGNRSPVEVAAKGRWTWTDLPRWAAKLGVPYVPNPWFPVGTLLLMRGAAGLRLRDPQALPGYLDAMFDAMWAQGRNLGDPAEVGAVLAAAGMDPKALLALAEDPQVKDALRRDTEEAVARGVFGAPSFFVGDELFFGQDRMDFVADALAGR